MGRVVASDESILFRSWPVAGGEVGADGDGEEVGVFWEGRDGEVCVDVCEWVWV